MKHTFEEEDIKILKDVVREVVKSELKKVNDSNKNIDAVFSVKSIAEYLQVKESWVYKQVSLQGIPFFKVGKYTRFKKSEIDKWAEKNTVKPVSLLTH